MSKTTKKSGNKIIFFGNERIATGVTTEAPTLQALINAGYDVVAVVSNYERGTSRSARDLEIAQVASQHNIPVLLPGKPAEIISQLRAYNAEIGVLVAYGKIVPESVIELFPKGIVNIHPSLLPLHRGPIPIESVILDGGSQKTGVSIMRLVKAMDAGPVFAQSELDLSGSETKQELADKLLEIGRAMLVEVLPGILDGTIVPLPQDQSRATYDNLISKDEGIIDWNKPAAQIEREIRAFLEWPKSRTLLSGKDVVVTKAHADSGPQTAHNRNPGTAWASDTKELAVQAGDGILIIEKLKPAGKPEMDAVAFINGYGKKLQESSNSN